MDRRSTWLLAIGFASSSELRKSEFCISTSADINLARGRAPYLRSLTFLLPCVTSIPLKVMIQWHQIVWGLINLAKSSTCTSMRSINGMFVSNSKLPLDHRAEMWAMRLGIFLTRWHRRSLGFLSVMIPSLVHRHAVSTDCSSTLRELCLIFQLW